MTNSVFVKWTNAVSGNYTSASDWDDNLVPNYSPAGPTEYDVALGGSATTGTGSFTVSSTANETIGYLDVNANATLNISGGTFKLDSYINHYASLNNLGTLNVGSSATLSFGPNLVIDGENWAEIDNVGTVNIAGKVQFLTNGSAFLGNGTYTLAGAKIVGANGSGGNGNSFANDDSIISGYGSIGNGTAASGGAGLILTNYNGATINATGAAGQTLVLNTGSNAIENAGLLETTGAGGLNLDSNLWQDGQLTAAGAGALTIINAWSKGGGGVNVSANGLLKLNNGEIDSGGILSIAAGGRLSTVAGNLIVVDANGDLAGDLVTANIQSDGTISVVDDSVLNLNASLYGAGKLTLSGSKLVIYGSGVSSYETGGISLSSGANNSIVSNGVGSQISNFSGIIGAGVIGDGELRLYNSPTGVVNANSSAGLTIVGDTAAVSAGSEKDNYNSGVLETTGSGGLTITGELSNAGYIYAAGGGAGALTLNGTAIDAGGGIVQTRSNGLILLENNVEIYNQAYVLLAANGTLETKSGDASDEVGSNIIDNGAVVIVGNSTLDLNSTVTGDGKVTLSGSRLALYGGGANFSQTGGMALSNSLSNFIVSEGAGTQLTNHTNISGAGTIGDGYLRLYNGPTGVVNADDSLALTIQGDNQAISNGSEKENDNAGLIETTGAGGLSITGQLSNAGYLEATGPGALTLNGTTIDSGGGIVETGPSSGTILLENNAQIYNQGYLWISAGGELTTASGDTADAIENNLYDYGSINVANGSALIAGGHYLDYGAININGTSALTAIKIQSNQTLQFLDGGTINLNGVHSEIVSQSSTVGANTATTLQNRGDTITGAGLIGDANMTIKNEAGSTIDATGTLTLNATQENGSGGTYIYNAGTIEASSGATLTIAAGMNSPGNLLANAGAIVAEGDVYGPGVATVVGAGSIEFGAIAGTNIDFSPGSAGTVIFDNSAGLGGWGNIWSKVFGFAHGDSIDLRDFAYSATGTTLYTGTNGTSFGPLDAAIVLSNGTATSAGIALEGNYTAGMFTFASDGHEIGTTGTYGTLITLKSGSSS